MQNPQDPKTQVDPRVRAQQLISKYLPQAAPTAKTQAKQYNAGDLYREIYGGGSSQSLSPTIQNQQPQPSEREAHYSQLSDQRQQLSRQKSQLKKDGRGVNFEEIQDLSGQLKKVESEIEKLKPDGVGIRFVNAANNFVQGFTGISVGALQGIATTAKWIDDTLGTNIQPGDVDEQFTYQLGERIRKIAEDNFKTDPVLQEEFTQQLAGGLGSFLGFWAGGAATRLATGSLRAGQAFAVGAAGFGGSGQAYEEAKIHGASEEDAQLASRWGFLPGVAQVSNAAFRVLDRWDKASGGLLREGMRKTIMESGKSGINEVLVEILGQAGFNKIAQEIYDAERPITEGLIESGAVGGSAGFLSDLILTGVGRRGASRRPRTIATYDGQSVEVIGSDTSGDLYIRTEAGTRLVPQSELSDIQTITPEQQVQAEKMENPSAIQNPETGEFLTPDDPGYNELFQHLQSQIPDSVVPIGTGDQSGSANLYIQPDGSYEVRSVTTQQDGAPVYRPVSEMRASEVEQVMSELANELKAKGDFTIDAFPVEPGNPNSPMQLFVVPSNSEAGQHLFARQQQEQGMQQEGGDQNSRILDIGNGNERRAVRLNRVGGGTYYVESVGDVPVSQMDATEANKQVNELTRDLEGQGDYIIEMFQGDEGEMNIILIGNPGEVVGRPATPESRQETIIQQAIDLIHSGQPSQVDPEPQAGQPQQAATAQVDPALETAPEQATVSDSIDSNLIYEFDGYTGNLTLDGKTVVIEGADTIVEIGNVDELSGSTLESLGISVISESGVEVSSDFSVTIGDRKYRNGYSNPMSAVTYDDQGNVINVTLDAEDGKKRTFRGQNADEIAYQYQLLFFENNATEQQIDNAIAQAENTDAETETQQAPIEQTQPDPVQSEPDQAQQQEELSLELDMKEALIDEFIENHNEQPFSTTDSHGTDIVVSRRTDGTDGWRLTTYRNGQPTGHTNYRSYESLLNELVFQFNGNLDSAEFSQSQAEQGPPRASTQFNVTGDIAKQAIDFGKSIPDSEIYTDGNDYGRETEPHVTLFYGLTEDAPDAVRDLIEGSGEVEVEFGEVSVFQNENYDVLMVEVESPRLRELHQQIKDELPNETDFPDYNPHMTIAYLKPGEGEKYMGDNQFQGQKTTFGELYHSGFDRKKTSIGMRPAAAPEAQSLETGTAEVGTVNPQFQDAPKAEGREHTRTLENGESRDSQFMVVPLESILASHNEVNFRQTEGYPTLEDGRTANDNDYQNSPEAQANVDNIARKLDERVFQNVPTVSSDGIVVDGNNRTMSMKRAQRSYPQRWKQYQDNLRNRAQEFGIDPAQLDGIENPVLVRVDRDVQRYDTDTYSQYNRQPNKEKSDVDRAVIASKKMTIDGLRRLTSLIDFDSYNTINEALNDRKTGKAVIDLMQNLGLISQNDRVRYFDAKTGAVTPDGKTYVSMVARGALLTERALRNSALDGVRQLSNTIESSLPMLINLRANHPQYDLSPYLSQAINAEKMRVDQGLTNDELYGQMSMFDDMSLDKDTALLHFLMKKGIVNFKRAIQVYHTGVESNAGNQLFASEARNQGQLIDDVINYLENKYTDDESRQTIQRVQRLSRPQAPGDSQRPESDTGRTDSRGRQQPEADPEASQQETTQSESQKQVEAVNDQLENLPVRAEISDGKVLFVGDLNANDRQLSNINGEWNAEKQGWEFDAVDTDAVQSAATIISEKTNEVDKADVVFSEKDNKISDTDTSEVSVSEEMEAARQAEMIQDFGEKIGMARKDTAESGFKRGKKAKDDRPAWAKKYRVQEQKGEVEQIHGWRRTKIEEGKYRLVVVNGKQFKSIKVNINSEQEAYDMIPIVEVSKNHRVRRSQKDNNKFAIYRIWSSGKTFEVQGGFDSEDAAKRYMVENSVELIETRPDRVERPHLDKLERIGIDRRDGDVTPEKFMDTFGFRGGEFGNWVRSDERQRFLNYAYDAFADLAEITGLSPKALSLNGRLSIGFGSRGRGLNSASAHFEPKRGVINLTKINGAGSLAHEWFHALDSYFGMYGRDSKVPNEQGVIEKVSDGDFLSNQRFNRYVRKELFESWRKVFDTMMYKTELSQYDTDVMQRRHESAVDRVVDNLNVTRGYIAKERSYGKKKKPATPKQLEHWDALTQRVKNGDLGEVIEVKSRKKYTSTERRYQVQKELSDLHKQITGRTLKIEFGTYSNIITTKGFLDDARQGVDVKRRTSTTFYRDSKEVDRRRASDYWSTPHEMAARAFESFIYDKLQQEGQQNDYLVHSVSNGIYQVLYDAKPFPEGQERTDINNAFDSFLNEMQESQDGDSTALFSFDPETSETMSSLDHHRHKISTSISEITSGWAYDGFVHVVNNENDLPGPLQNVIRSYGVQGRINGMFIDNKVYLLADNLRGVEHARRTLAHEAIGHLGIRSLIANTSANRADFEKRLNNLFDEVHESFKDRQLYKETAAKYGADLSTQEGRRLAADEYLAKVAEGDLTPTIRQKLVRLVNDILQALGLDVNMTDADVLNLLSDAKKLVEGNGYAMVMGDGSHLRTAFYSFDASGQTQTPEFNNWFGEWQLERDLVSLIDNDNNTIDYEKLKEIAGRIGQGNETIGRLTQSEEKGRTEGGRRNVEASLILRAKESANRTEQETGRGNETRQPRRSWEQHKQHVKPQEDLLEQYARHEGIWYDFDTIQQENTFLDEGMEAKVFEESKDHVIKVVGYDFIKQEKTPQDYLDRITLHNFLFPETKYELIGFTRDGEYFKFVVRQPFIEGEVVPKDELVAYMKDVYDANDRDSRKNRYFSDNYLIEDLHELNVFKTPEGELAFIDPYIDLNYSDGGWGGQREQVSNERAASKAVNEDGTPKVMYHGTAADFSAFDPGKATDAEGRKRGMGWGANKFYFTESPIAAGVSAEFAQLTDRGDAPNIMPVYLDIRNPITAEEYQRRIKEFTDLGLNRDDVIARIDSQLQAEGIDGIIDSESGAMAVFEPGQIKSATGNQGTFDRNNPDIRFAQNNRPASPQQVARHRKMVRDTVKNITKKWANDEFVSVVNSADDLPASIQRELIQQNNHNSAAGLFVGGQVYLISDNIRDGAHAERTLAHEAFGHLGLRSLTALQSNNEMNFNARLNTILDDVYDSYKATPKLKDIARRYNLDLRSEEDRRIAAEEYIAHAAEGDLTPTMWDKVIKFVNDILKDLGFGTGYTRADILRLLNDSQRLVEGDRYAHFIGDGSHLRTAFYRLNAETVNERFNSELDHLIEGKLMEGHVFALGRPAAILRSAGFDDLPIEMAASRLVGKQVKHDYPLEALNSLPDAIQNPIAVFDSNTRIGSKTILTELSHDGKNFLAAVELNENGDGVVVNDVRSVYPKAAKGLVKAILSKHGRYYNKEKAQSWLDQQRSHYAEVIKHELGSAHKIVNDFENPNLDSDMMFILREDSDLYDTRHTYPAEQGREAVTRTDDDPTSIVDYGEERSVPGGFGRIARLKGLFIEPLHWLEQSPHLKPLADKVRDHYDDWARRRGRAYGRAHERILVPLKKLKRKERNQILDQYEEYIRLRETGKKDQAKTLSLHPLAQEMVDYTGWLGRYAGSVNRQVGVKVFDPRMTDWAKIEARVGVDGVEAIKKLPYDRRSVMYSRLINRRNTQLPTKAGWRDIGQIADFFPRKLNAKTEATLRNPTRNEAHWNALIDALIEEGHVKDRAEADRYLKLYRKEYTENNYFAGIEKARLQALPSMAYDYRFEVMMDYMNKWSERVSQIQHFGQVTTPDTKDAFDKMMGEVADENTRNLINALQGRVYNRQSHDGFHQAISVLNKVATGLQLGNFGTASLNLIGGVTLSFMGNPIIPTMRALAHLARPDFHPPRFRGAGFMRGLSDMVEFKNLADAIQEGRTRGAITNDMIMLLRDTSNVNSFMQAPDVLQRLGLTGAVDTNELLNKIVNFTMKWGGYIPTETFIRAHAQLSSKYALLDKIADIKKNPQSKRSLKHIRSMQEHGFDYRQLVDEGGQGTYTERYIRYMSNHTMGSYRVDQVPIHVDTPTGRFFFKYMKFITQVSRMWYKDFYRPFAASIQGGSKVQVEVDGIMTTQRVREFSQMLKFFAVSAIGGDLVRSARAFLFDYTFQGPEIEELEKALEDDDRMRALLLIFDRAYWNIQATGGLLVFGNYAQLTGDVFSRERSRNPLEPPGYGVAKNTADFALDIFGQKAITTRDVDQFIERQISLYRTVKRPALKGYSALEEALGIPQWREAAIRDFIRERNYARGLVRRWQKEQGIEGAQTRMGRIGRTENTVTNNRIHEALSVGDVQEAVDAMLRKADGRGEEFARIRRSAITSMNHRRPYGNLSKSNTIAFEQWLTENMPEQIAERAKQAEQSYQQAKNEFEEITSQILDRIRPIDRRLNELEDLNDSRDVVQREIERLNQLKQEVLSEIRTRQQPAHAGARPRQQPLTRILED